MRAANAAFQHASAPDRNIVLPSNVVHSHGFTETADAADLDIDDAAGAQFNGSTRVAARVNRLIEADAGLELPLQLGMKVEIVMPERLLDHEQAELVELFEVLHVLKRVSGVGIATEEDVRPALADFRKDLNVPPRLAFDLDAPISGA